MNKNWGIPGFSTLNVSNMDRKIWIQIELHETRKDEKKSLECVEQVRILY